MKIYNTLTRKIEEFIPINPSSVKMYGCGITPYDYSHLGHAMQGIVFDVIRRYLEFRGYKVIYVRNYTDVDDKIVNAAKDKKINALTLSQNMIDVAEDNLKNLGIKPANFAPKVSETIQDIIDIVMLLINKGYAYSTSEGNVYFRIEKFAEYGKLSNQNINNLLEGTRKDTELDKEDFKDFALWKAHKQGEIFWESPWGKGRPGWHIECSAMCKKYLGESIDIHGGGKDLVFPHHENEIAQSEAAFSKPLAKYWMHNGMMNLNGEKMSKSTKNYILIKDALNSYHSQSIRYAVLTNHYRSDQDYSEKRFRDSQKRIYYYYKTLLQNGYGVRKQVEFDKNNPYVKEFISIMDNDFNTVEVFSRVDTLFKRINDKSLSDEQKKQAFRLLNVIGEVLGIFNQNPNEVVDQIKNNELKKQGIDNKFVDQLIEKRKHLRSLKKYQEADELRVNAQKHGISISDSGDDIPWDPMFN